MEFFKLLFGFVVLIIGGNLLVQGSVSLARKFRISKIVIGLTVVSFATSAPELIVSIYAAISGHSDIVIGNVIGSNIANVSLVLGTTSCIFPLYLNKRIYYFDLPIMLLANILFGFFLYSQSTISFYEGIILVSLLVLLTTYLISKSRSKLSTNNVSNQKIISLFLVIFYIITGSVCLYFGSQLLIDGAVAISSYFGFTERVISVSVIAFGTSVPELSASIVAAFKSEKSLSIGNLIGSNIFNIFAVLGVTSIIQPIICNDLNLLNFDFFWMLGLSFFLFPLMMFGYENKIGRFKGSILLISYFLFLVFVF